MCYEKIHEGIAEGNPDLFHFIKLFRGFGCPFSFATATANKAHAEAWFLLYAGFAIILLLDIELIPKTFNLGSMPRQSGLGSFIRWTSGPSGHFMRVTSFSHLFIRRNEMKEDGLHLRERPD
jgi:hypothetical protein